MTFEEEINELEKLEFEDDFTINKGTIPILFSACHTMIQNHENCTKLNEPYTKAISLFCNRKLKHHLFNSSKINLFNICGFPFPFISFIH